MQILWYVFFNTQFIAVLIHEYYIGQVLKMGRENSFELILPGDFEAYKKKAEHAQQAIDFYLVEFKLLVCMSTTKYMIILH